MNIFKTYHLALLLFTCTLQATPLAKELWHAFWANLTDTIEQLLKDATNEDVNTLAHNDSSFIWYIICNGIKWHTDDVPRLSNAYAIAQALLEKGAQVETLDLFFSGAKDDRMFQILLPFSTKTTINQIIDLFQEKDTLLHAAVKENWGAHHVKLLLKHGADPNIPDDTGRLPIAYATDELQRYLDLDTEYHSQNADDSEPEDWEIEDYERLCKRISEYQDIVNQLQEAARNTL